MAAHALSLNYKAISPWLEMGAYEALWDTENASFEALAARFSAHPDSLPSDFIPDKSICEDYASKTIEILNMAGVRRFGVRLNGAGEYPYQLREAVNPIEMLYF